MNIQNAKSIRGWDRRFVGWRTKGGTKRGDVYKMPLGIVVACIAALRPGVTLGEATKVMVRRRAEDKALGHVRS